jgi:ubiquinone/menaquinone biosynthesis C-methylase UbiE
MRMDVKGFYEKVYGADSTAGSKTSFLYRKLKRFELNRCDLASQAAPGGDSLLDIACGDGDLLLRLKDRYREVWGVDIAASRINRITEKLGSQSNIHARVEDVNSRLSFNDGSFDTITAVAIVEHVFDPYHMFKECHRLLRKGGTLIVEVPNVAWLSNRIGLLLGKLPVTSSCTEGWDGGHLHYFTRTSLKNLFQGEGFKVVKVTSGGIFARPRRIWGSLLGADILVVGVKE